MHESLGAAASNLQYTIASVQLVAVGLIVTAGEATLASWLRICEEGDRYRHLRAHIKIICQPRYGVLPNVSRHLLDLFHQRIYVLLHPLRHLERTKPKLVEPRTFVGEGFTQLRYACLTDSTRVNSVKGVRTKRLNASLRKDYLSMRPKDKIHDLDEGR